MRQAILRLTLTDFRNYEALRLDTRADSVILTGPNGAGKTNLLEAVSMLAPGRGLRGAGFEAMARIGGPGRWAIAAQVAGNGESAIGTSWSRPLSEDESATRQVVIDGVPQRSSGALGDHLSMLWLTPGMDGLFTGPAADRRRFLDRLTAAYDAEHASRIAVFEKAMRERNLVLASGNPDAAWLTGLEGHMAEAAAAIAAARNSAIEILQNGIDRRRGESRFPWAILTIEGTQEQALRRMPAVQVEDEYRRLLADSRGSDSAAGRTLNGPHRSDFQVIHGPKAMPAGYCSTGEQKALLTGLVLAQAAAVGDSTGRTPILLLDEVAAHLDVVRRRGLFEALTALGAQVWMTGTDMALFDDCAGDCLRLHVEAATVTGEMRKA
jgi:DNA replication and repair protein RecF